MARPRSVRLFENRWMERLSRIHPTTPFKVYLPVVTLSLLGSITWGGLPVWRAVGFFLAGLLGWTLMEYVLHRWLFHFKPKSAFGRRQQFVMHGVHHEYPHDDERHVAPLIMSVPLAVGFFSALALMLPLGPALAAFSGLVLGYLGYDFTHHWAHVPKQRTRIGRALRRRHMLHHFQDDGALFGVTSPLWDYVFRTHKPRPRQVPVENGDRVRAGG